MSFNQLIGICVDLKPSLVVAPDFIGQPKESRYVADEFISLLRLHKEEYQTVMEVIHGTGDPWDYINLYKSSKADWIGVPKRLPDRVELFHNLKRADQIVMKPHHALGLNKVDANQSGLSYMIELEALASLKVFRSCDSGKPSSENNNYTEARLRDIDAICRKYA